MKKIAALLLILAFTESPAQVEIGFLGGVNFTEAAFDNFSVSASDYMPTFGFGAVIDYKIRKNMGFRFEPMYVVRSTSLSTSLFDLRNIRLETAWFEVPVMFKIETGNNFRPFFMGGISAAFNLDSEIKIGYSGFEYSQETGKYTNDMVWNLCLGGGLIYKMDEVSLFVEGRYSKSLNNIAEAGIDDFDYGASGLIPFSGTSASIKTSGFQVLFGFMIPFEG